MALERDAVLMLAAGDVIDGDVSGSGDAILAGAVAGGITLGGELRVLRGGSVDGPVICRELTLCAGGEVRGAAQMRGVPRSGRELADASPPTATRIPSGFRVDGDARAEGDLHISGHVDGDVRVRGCLRIGREGTVQGRVWATHGVIDGEVLGAVNRCCAPPSSPGPAPLPTEPTAGDLPRVGRVAARRRHV